MKVLRSALVGVFVAALDVGWPVWSYVGWPVDAVGWTGRDGEMVRWTQMGHDRTDDGVQVYLCVYLFVYFPVFIYSSWKGLIWPHN